MENKELLKRRARGAAAFSISSECVEVILFGANNRVISDTAILGFGMF